MSKRRESYSIGLFCEAYRPHGMYIGCAREMTVKKGAFILSVVLADPVEARLVRPQYMTSWVNHYFEISTAHSLCGAKRAL